MSTSGHGARIELALQPAAAKSIPDNVSARLLPKTLFGERYVELVLPAAVPAPAIRSGDVIPQDRSSSAIELEQVFDDLLPLLQAVQPAQLSATLNALATALDGRGKQLGQNLVALDTYLKGLNPHLPTLTQRHPAADVGRDDLLGRRPGPAHDGAQPVGDGGHHCGQTGFARPVPARRDRSGQRRRPSVLQQDGGRIIQVGQLSRPTLQTLARYSPEFSCLTKGLTGIEPRLTQAFSGDALHITLEVVTPRPAYQQGQEPVFADTSAPDCRGLPQPGREPGAPLPAEDVRRRRRRLGPRLRATCPVRSRWATPARRPSSGSPTRSSRPSSGAHPAPGLEPAARADGPRHGGEPVSEDHRQPGQADRLRRRDAARVRRPRRRRSPTCSSAPRPATRRSSPTRPGCRRATTCGSPACGSARSRASAWSARGRDVRGQGRFRGPEVLDPDPGHRRGHPLPQPDRPAVRRADRGHRLGRRRCRRARPSRSAGPSRRSTSTSSSTGSSRCSPRCRRTTSTSCPARSSRCCRARAAASTSCWPTRRR